MADSVDDSSVDVLYGRLFWDRMLEAKKLISEATNEMVMSVYPYTWQRTFQQLTLWKLGNMKPGDESSMSH